jgi:hypothetical protein
MARRRQIVSASPPLLSGFGLDNLGTLSIPHRTPTVRKGMVTTGH